MKIICISLIKLYQIIVSPFLGSNCRFYPSCSSYAISAIDSFGSIKGLNLSIKRLLKCHPFNDGGIDLVPIKKGNYKWTL